MKIIWEGEREIAVEPKGGIDWSERSYPSDGQAISAHILANGGGGGGGGRVVATPTLKILIIACLTFCLLLTDRPTLTLLKYKLKVVNICKMHGTGGLEVLVL